MRADSAGLSGVSNRHRSTWSATSEKTATLTPRPSQVAPSGYGDPRCTRIALLPFLQAVGRHERRRAAAGDQVGDEGGPARLMGGAEAGPGVAVEVLEEQQRVVPVGVGLQSLVVAEDRPAAARALRGDAHQPARP